MEKSRTDEYREARRLKNISAYELGMRKYDRGETSMLGGIGQAIKEKTKARVTRVKEKFDVLNMASFFLGSEQAISFFGRNRSAADVRYFKEKNKGRKRSLAAKAISLPFALSFGLLNMLMGKKKMSDDGDDDDPYHTTVGSGSQRPVQRSDGVADVFAKVYNALDKMFEQEKMFKEIRENFREEQNLEEERRHGELIEALTGQKPTASPVEKKEGGGLLDILKGLFDSFMGQFTGLMTILAPLLGPLATGLAGLITAAAPFILGLAGIAAIVAGAALLAERIGKFEKDRLQERGGPEAVEAQKKVMAAPAASPIQESYDELGGVVVSDEAQIEAEKTQKLIQEKQATVKKLMADQGYTVEEKGLFGGVTYRKPTSAKGGARGQEADESIVKKARDDADKLMAGKMSKPTATPQPPAPAQKAPSAPAATPAMAPVSSVPPVPKVEASTRQNMDLNLNDNMQAADAPVIINKGSTRSLNLGGEQTGTITGPASVRDDSIGDVVANLQKRAMVS